jgi:hypothetical protein
LRIGSTAGATSSWLGVANTTGVFVEPWSETIIGATLDYFRGNELSQSVCEKGLLVGSQASEYDACAAIAALHSRIGLGQCHSTKEQR